MLVVFVLADELYIHTGHSMCEGNLKHTHKLGVKYVPYVETDFLKRKKLVTTGNIAVRVGQ